MQVAPDTLPLMASSHPLGVPAVLWRFRDMIADTIASHKSVIDAHGACWWGWWKRPRENERRDVWDPLSTVDPGNPVTVALFDSGTGKLWRALVTEAIAPSADDVREVPPAEKELVPGYYRESPFSRGWLKLIRIEAWGADEFYGKYAYAEPPPLPGIPDALLSRLRGKLIIDRDELAAMDTTVWRIAVARAGASLEHFLAPSLTISSPVSPEVVRLKANTILHLSDLHFDRRGRGAQSGHIWDHSDHLALQDMVARAVKGKPIGAVLVTGDLTSVAHATEFDSAAKAISAMLGVFGIGPDALVVCPGNHDIAWTKNFSDVYESKVDLEPDVTPAIARDEYLTFFRKVFRHEPNADLSMGRRWLLPSGQLVEICALNSSTLAAGKRYLAGLGRVGTSAFRTVADQLSWDSGRNAAFRVLALHHHVTQTEDVEDADEYYTGFGIAVDAKKLMRDAAERRVQLVVHGHRHRAFFWREGVCQLPEFVKKDFTPGHISVLGGGSVGSTSAPSGNCFNTITFGLDGVRVDVFKSEKGADFDPITAWFAPLDAATGKLGEWEHMSRD